MAAYNKIEGFVGYLTTKIIDCNADQWDVYLSNTTPSASADNVKADLAAITEENNYAEADAQNTSSEASGTATIVGVDIVFTASGGTFGPFRYVVIFDETVSSPVVDPLIAWWDYGSAITPADGETFTVDFGASIFTLA